jgi:hypothetical protein
MPAAAAALLTSTVKCTTSPRPAVGLPDDFLTDRSGARANAAVALVVALNVNEQEDEYPLQAPPQPRNAEPVAGVAVSVTAVP